MVGQTDLLQHLRRGEGVRGDLLDQRDVFVYRQRRHEVVKLEHKAHRRGAVVGKLVAREGGNILALHVDLAAGRAVQTAQQVQKRALARTAGAEDDDEFALLKPHVHVVERTQLVVAADIDAADVLEFNNCHYAISSCV